MKVEILSPSGCCHGVNSAINKVKSIRNEYKDVPIYVLGMLVHNEEVIKELDQLNIVTITNKSPNEAINEIDKGIVIFTAHGHDARLDVLAQNKGLITIDTTCPFVKANHMMIKKALANNESVIFIGKRNHPETESTLLISPKINLYDINSGLNYEKIKGESPTIFCQTTLSILELENIKKDIFNHFPNAHFAKSVCNATYERQSALKTINPNCDLIFVVGSNLSSNTSKLYEIAKSLYPSKHIKQIKTVNDIIDCDLTKFKYATIVGGASTPIIVLENIKNYLLNL